MIEVQDLEAKSGHPDFDVLFQKVVEMMPDLLANMKDDLSKPENKLIREFIPLESDTHSFQHHKPRFEYYGK